MEERGRCLVSPVRVRRLAVAPPHHVCERYAFAGRTHFNLHSRGNRSRVSLLCTLQLRFHREIQPVIQGLRHVFYWSLFLKAEASRCAWCGVADRGCAALGPGSRPRRSTRAVAADQSLLTAPAAAATSRTLLLQTRHANGLVRSSCSRDALMAPSIVSSGFICTVARRRISSRLKG